MDLALTAASVLLLLLLFVVNSFIWKIGESFVNSIVEKVREYLEGLIWEQVVYLIDYDRNIKTLKTEVDKLGVIQNEVQHSVDVAKNNGQCTGPSIDSWLATVNQINKEVERFLEDEATKNKRWLGGWCPDLISRYLLSWEAKKKTQDVIGLQAENTWLNFADFGSRILIMDEIMAALKDDNINVIGICGLGGIGKTTTVKKVGNRAKVEKLFDEIVIAVVSQTPDLKKIQDEIADKLGLRFDEQSLPGRADRLRARLMDCKRLLIILDDFWERLDLEAVGIPFGCDHKGCKVILTSRSQDVCSVMGTVKNFTIGVLYEHEAWNLLKEKAGNSIDSLDLHPIAKEVVRECGGLPIVIVTVGMALKDKNKRMWSDALRQLRLSSPENISGMEKYVFRSIELSYNFLESQEAKLCLLLCCIFDEDTNILVEDLVRYGMGLGLFKGIDALVEARDRVYTLVHKLKSCYLLLDSDNEECVKMHDIVRDVIRSIAIQGKDAFMLRHGLELKGWPTKGMVKQYTSISLISNKIHELLLLACMDDSLEAPDNLFEGMKELKVLKVRRMLIRSPPSSLSFLKKLQTLCLDDCKLQNISAIGELETLTILSLCGSSIKQLPREIGKLTRLQFLDLTGCESLTRISPGVISSLIRLEELYMRNTFVQWEVEEGGREKKNVNIAELQSLYHLITLEIHLPTAKFPGSNFFFEKLVKFKISIGLYGDLYWCHGNQFQTELKLDFDEMIPVESGINALLKKTETLCLAGLQSGPDNYTRESFVHLKCLKLSSCDGQEYLTNTVDSVPHSVFPILESLEITKVQNLKMICHGQLPVGSFGQLRFLELCDLPELMHLWKGPIQLVSLGNLRRVVVEGCYKLENLFSLSIAGGLVQLEDLQIYDCERIEEIVATEEEHEKATSTISFPKLSYLMLLGLPNIIGFFKKMDEIEFPHHLSTLCLERLPKLRSFCPNSLAAEGNEDNATQHLFNEKVKSVCELRSMRVSSCGNILNVFSSNLVQSLHNLGELEIDKCGSLEVVFDFEGINIDEGHAAVTLSCLTNLKLSDLPNLTHVWKRAPQEIQGFQNLRLLKVVECPSLKTIFSPSIAKLLVKLETLEVRRCEMMEKIVGEDQVGREEAEEATKVIVFPELNYLHLDNLPNLMNFCPNPYTLKWPSLKKLSIQCPKMKRFAPAFEGARNQRTDNVSSYEELQEGNFNASIQDPIFSEQVSFPNMEVLELRCDYNAEVILQGQLLAGSLCKLRDMHVECCAELLNVVPSNLLHRLPHLEKLNIDFCTSLVEVFETDGLNIGERDIFLLSKLKILHLRLLPALKHIWKREPKGMLYLQSLSVLHVYNCRSLRNLFSPSMTKSVEQLQELVIEECEMMTEIVADDRAGDETAMDKIEFTQLRRLTLQRLSNLISFSPTLDTMAFDAGSGDILQKVNNLHTDTRHIFNERVEFPSLEELKLTNMDKLNQIWCSELPTCSFSELKVLKVYGCHKLLHVAPFHVLQSLANLEEVSVQLCNSLEEVFEFKGLSVEEGQAAMLPRLKEMTLKSLPKLMQICKMDYKGTMGFQNLKLVKVEDCGSLRHLFYSSMARGLVRLEELYIAYCGMMEEIVAKGDQKGRMGFQNLKLLKVERCGSLRNVFYPSLARGLVHLENLLIEDCQMMKEIVVQGEEEEEERMEKIVIPQLKRLKLSWLPNLTSFCCGLYAFDFPSLEDVNIHDCPKMKISSFKFLIKHAKARREQQIFEGKDYR